MISAARRRAARNAMQGCLVYASDGLSTGIIHLCALRIWPCTVCQGNHWRVPRKPGNSVISLR